MKTRITSIFLIVFACAITFAQSKEERKKAKQERIQYQYELAKDIVKGDAFTFEIVWMKPQIGKPQHMRHSKAYFYVNNNNAKGYFPYFGFVRTGDSFVDGGIEFDNEIKDYEVNYNDEKAYINIAFKVKGKRENYTIDIYVNKGMDSKITIYSNKRDGISYDGFIQGIEE